MNATQTIQTEIERRLRAAMPDARIELRDLTGTADHWQAVVVSSAFEGKTPVARQRAVFDALGEMMHGPIHALTLKTLTPAQAGQA
ncbi:BolA family transcriptional regulator [Myxococcota bacterium]|jgi:stress-induced morphogen|nr:BolA family transcriptional regulator [Myxococcota bacterium]